MTTARRYDQNGWFEVRRNPLSKAGVFPYRGASIGASDPDRIYMVYRPEEELAHPETIASYKMLPWIDDHVMLGGDEGMTPAEMKGVHGVIGEQVEYDPATRTLFGNLKVWSQTMASLIAAGKKELSCGFRCVYEFATGNFEGQAYDAIQRQIRGNHIALVREGRMGPAVAVLDHSVFAFDAKELTTMKIKRRDLIAKHFGFDAALSAAFHEATKMVPAMDEEVDDAVPAEGAMTLADVTTMLKAIGPQLSEMQKALTALAPVAAAAPAVVEEVAEADLEPVLDGAGKPTFDSAGKPAMKKKAKAATGADAADVKALVGRLDTAEATLKTFATDGMKGLLAEIGKRDALAAKLVPHIGTFDHADMTALDVAKYGCDKLGLKPTTGHEGTALDAYLTNRTAPSKERTFALDSAGTGAAKVDSYLKG